MTKPMDKKEVLFDAFHNQLAEVLHYYNLPPMTQEEALALVNKAWHKNQPSTTHYDGCWRDHLACAIAEIERLTRLLEAKA